MSTYAARLTSHATLIRSKSETFRRLLLFLMMLLWKSAPRLLLASISCTAASRALKVISLLGTLKLAYVVFNPPAELVAGVEPITKIAGLPASNIIAMASAALIALIFAAAATMAILEAHYKNETIKTLELFLISRSIEINRGQNSEITIESSKLAELTKSAINFVNASSLAAILTATWILMFLLSPKIALAMAFFAALAFSFVLYYGSWTRRKSSRFKRDQKRLRIALESAGSPHFESKDGKAKQETTPDYSKLFAQTLTAHDSRTVLSNYSARLNAVTLLSTGAIIGMAVLLLTNDNIVGVIMVLLLVRFFLTYAQNLANNLQQISNRLDTLNWAQRKFSSFDSGA